MPEDLKIVAVSHIFRELNKSKPEVQATMKRSRYLLLNQERFSEFLGKLNR